MSKQIVKFLKTHGRYVKGDVAGFAPATVAAWPKGVCEPYDPKVATGIGTVALDTSAAQKLIEDARAEFAQKGGELDTREADLKAREEALAAREAALSAQAEGALVVEEAAAEPEQVDAPKKPAGAPPKQGAKA
ncbi:MAG: hypothetical protein EpisKO_33010 [Epibacterium sp.]